MPSIKSFTMTYDALNEYGTFSEGDTITGNVTLNLFKATSVQSLYVKAKGDARVRWTQKSGDRTHTYSANRRYFKLKEFLIPEDSNETVVPTGIHVYKFSLKIPSGSMPSSFRGRHGNIVYSVEAVLSRSWRMDSTVDKEINFVSKAFPNLHTLMSRQVGSTNKEIGLFSKGQAHMDVTVDKTAYAPGETVAIVARINNSSSSEMTPKFSLIQDVVYKANSSIKHESSVINKVVDKCIKPKTEKEVRCAMTIPLGQTQTMQNCDIISVEYHLKVYLDISFSFDPKVKFPVVIIPPNLAAGPQPFAASGPYPEGATGGPSDSDFPPPAVSMGLYPASPHSVSYPGAQNYSVPRPAYPENPSMYACPPYMYPAQPARMSLRYNNPVPPAASPYGSPFSSSSSTSVLHPPPTAPMFHPPPSAPEICPSSSSTFDISPPPPTYNMLPSAPMMNTDFLSQVDEPPPSYSLLFPSSTSENNEK